MELTLGAISFVLRNPRTALVRIVLGKDGFLSHCLSQLTRTEESTVRRIYSEAVTLNELESYIRSRLEVVGGGQYRGQVSFDDARLLYTLCRLVGPRYVVETGVATGVSSAFILKALDDNQHGILHSVDMPNYEEVLAKNDPAYAWMREHPVATIPQGEEVGFAIPPGLRARWKLHLGLSQRVLPEVLAELGRIDVFIHDSEHTYKNMMFEYQTAWPSIRESGFLLSHDVGWNSAFADFSIRVGRQSPLGYLTGLGGLRK